MAKKTYETLSEAQKIYEEFENATSFKGSINLLNDIKRSVLFENGKQWNMDEDIKEFPKITLNIIKQIGKTRKSGIMSNEYGYLVNSNNFKSVRKIQDFLKHLASAVNLRNKDLKALSDDFTKGTAIGYFYWDAEKRGFMKKSGGEMRYEIIDIRNFAVANPYIQDIQDQEWVIYVTRETIESLKKKYGDRNYVADGNLYTTATEVENITTNLPDQDLVNVYTKFYRNEEGQVFFIISTQLEILRPATPLNPFYEKGNSAYQPNTTSLPDELSEEAKKAAKTRAKENEEQPKASNPFVESLIQQIVPGGQKAQQNMPVNEPLPKVQKDKRTHHIWNLYPFAKLSLNERDNCFYGLPITLEYIESQKSINNHYSVYDKALQDNVLGGFMFRKGVIDSNEVTTENGQMLELDTLPNESIGSAFARLPVANVPADSVSYSQNLIGLTRQIAGASNVQLGMADFAGQSGKQTQMLLQRAQENSSDNAMTFNDFKKQQAKIMFLFAKFFYDNEEFAIIEHGAMKDQTRLYNEQNVFNGTEYLEDDVMIDIKVGAAASFSEYSNVEMLGLMVQSGQAPFEAYVSMLPDGYISNRQELIEVARNNSNMKIQQLEQQIQQSQLVMEQMNKAYQQTQKDLKNIDTVIQENTRLKAMLADISAKSIERVRAADEQTAQMTDDLKGIIQAANRGNKAEPKPNFEPSDLTTPKK